MICNSKGIQAPTLLAGAGTSNFVDMLVAPSYIILYSNLRDQQTFKSLIRNDFTSVRGRGSEDAVSI